MASAQARISAGGGLGGWDGPGGGEFGGAFVAVILVVVVSDGSTEVAVGPLLGELAGLAEYDRHGWEPDLRLGETLGNYRGVGLGRA